MKLSQAVTTPDGDAERARILDTAAALFERYGYKKTTIEDIAQEAGIGKGSVYLRFESKEEIGLAWLRSLHEHLFTDATARKPGETPRVALRQFLVRRVMLRFDVFSRHRRSLDEALSSLKPQLEEKKRAFHEREAEYVADLVREGAVEGTLASDDPIEDARTMVLATNSLLPYSIRPDQIGDRPAVLRQAEGLAEMLTRAVEVRHG
ncbi:MAG: TetR/AcrR family transcriptional regulator [Armatimonadetes bacterium]|nr:TetR/AcrR family transcriptional regulator [Armatimonadota bacterium]